MKKKPMSSIEKKLTVALVAASLVSAWLMFGRPLPAPSDARETWARVKTAASIESGVEDGAVAVFWSPRRPEEIKSALLDIKGYSQRFPRVGKIDELARHGDEVTAAGRFRFFGPVKASFAFTAQAAPLTGGGWSVKWKGTGTGLASNEGGWELRPYENGTAVAYHVKLRTGSALLPPVLLDRIVARGLPSVLKDFSEGMK